MTKPRPVDSVRSLDDAAALANQLRVDSIRMSTAAGSGRPTSSLSAAELMAVLLARHLRMDWTDPGHRGNDRLIFSKGHASPLLYAMFKAAGFHVWVLCGDSEMAEGSMWEALDKAGHFGLANLTAIVDVNP